MQVDSKMIRFGVVCVLFVVRLSECEFQNKAFHWIKSVEDNSFLTAFSDFNREKWAPGKVITSNWQGSPEQKWQTQWTEFTGTELRSENNTKNKLYLWAPEGSSFHVTEEWDIIHVKESQWHAKNRRSKKCLVNWGLGREVGEWDCETVSRNQLWIFYDVNEQVEKLE